MMDSEAVSSSMMVSFRSTSLALAALLTATLSGAELPPPLERQVDFSSEVQPLFEQRCSACHGSAQQMNGLRLDLKKAALAGGHSGPAILPGNSAESRLIHLVAGYRVKVVMPPAGPALSNEEVGLLRAWIDQGAEWPEENEADTHAA